MWKEDAPVAGHRRWYSDLRMNNPDRAAWTATRSPLGLTAARASRAGQCVRDASVFQIYEQQQYQSFCSGAGFSRPAGSPLYVRRQRQNRSDEQAATVTRGAGPLSGSHTASPFGGPFRQFKPGRARDAVSEVEALAASNLQHSVNQSPGHGAGVQDSLQGPAILIMAMSIYNRARHLYEASLSAGHLGRSPARALAPLL